MSQVNNIMFVSGHCSFCEDVIAYINKHGMKSHFLFVSVDNAQNRQRMPPQIDRVPALLIRDKGVVLFEDEIMKFIRVKDTEPDIAPMEQPASGFSENFSFIEGADDSLDTISVASKNYSLFGQEQQITTPEDDGTTKSKPDNSNMLDRYMSQRANDVSAIFGDKKIVS
jgi:glutaredoxin-related protein